MITAECRLGIDVVGVLVDDVDYEDNGVGDGDDDNDDVDLIGANKG